MKVGSFGEFLIFGILVSQAWIDRAQACENTDTRYFGTGVGVLTASSWENCGYLCRYNRPCYWWSWNSNDRQCYMFSNPTDFETNPLGWTSGFWNCPSVASGEDQGPARSGGSLGVPLNDIFGANAF